MPGIDQGNAFVGVRVCEGDPLIGEQDLEPLLEERNLTLPLRVACTSNPHSVSVTPPGTVGTGSGGAAMAGVIDRAVAASASTEVLKKRFTIAPSQ